MILCQFENNTVSHVQFGHNLISFILELWKAFDVAPLNTKAIVYYTERERERERERE